MTKNTAYLLAAVFCLLSSAPAFSQDSLDVHARLRLADDKKTYRNGEAIRLVLELTADRDGYTGDTMPDRSEPTTDTIAVTPEAGISYWLNELRGGARGMRDVIMRVKLTTSPATIPIMINDYVRFNRPGRYSVTITTTRVAPERSGKDYKAPFSLTTNTVTFDVEPMSEGDEEREVKRISDLIDSARGSRAEEAAVQQLAYLTGSSSTREKVRRFLSDASSNSPGNSYAHYYHGLFIAQDRAVVLRALETALRDPNQSVTHGMLSSVTSLRLLQERADLPGKSKMPPANTDQNGDPRYREVRDAYITEIAATLDKRSGKSLTNTALIILNNPPREEQSAAAIMAETRRILVENFDSLHPFDQESLLSRKWDELRDPSLVPSLKKILTSTGIARGIHGIVLKRLIEIAPDEARSYVIAEIRNPSSLVDLEAIGGLADKTLPEVDAALVLQIRGFISLKNPVAGVFLQQKTVVAARYATKSIYADLMDIYRSADDSLPVEARPGLLAYFARYNEGEALALLEQALDKAGPSQQFSILPGFAKLYFSDAVDALLRKRLESDDPEIAGTAAYLISLYGAAPINQ